MIKIHNTLNLRIGDCVICIDADGYDGSDGRLCVGKIYKLTHIQVDGWFDLDETNTGWLPSRFRLAEPHEIDYYNFPNKLEKLIE